MSTTIEPSVLNLRQTATALNCCIGTVRNMIAAGELKSIKLRDRRDVRKADLQRFLDQAAEAA
jgi:excisionase family DNA binding protein